MIEERGQQAEIRPRAPKSERRPYPFHPLGLPAIPALRSATGAVEQDTNLTTNLSRQARGMPDLRNSHSGSGGRGNPGGGVLEHQTFIN